MTDTRRYTPSNEFREHLEWEVRRRFRRNENQRFHATARSTRWAKAAAIVGISIAIGTTAGFASAQIRQNAGRDSLLSAAQAEASLAKLRMELAKMQADDVSLKVRLGVLDQQQLVSANADLANMMGKLNRTALNILEIRASGRAPNDDLNAPLVDGRDYVKERIEADAMTLQQRLKGMEASQLEAERRARVYSSLDSSLARANVEVTRATADLSVLAEKLKLRAEFLDRGTSMADLMPRLERAQVTADALVAQEQLKAAQARLELVQKRRAAGVADDVELLRAQLDVRESQLALQRISVQLKRR